MYSTVLFDLDGTLTESGIGITRGVAYALEKQGIVEKDQKKLERFVGPSLVEAFQEFYGLSPEASWQALADYRVYYAETGIFENRVYDGVKQVLQQLCQEGRRCILATAKPELYAVQILEHFGLAEYFSMVAGASMDETRRDKTSVIAYALEQAGITDRTQVVMVGDREHDILGAKDHGLDSIGVLYGYGSREELETAGATYIAAAVEEILRYV